MDQVCGLICLVAPFPKTIRTLIASLPVTQFTSLNGGRTAGFSYFCGATTNSHPLWLFVGRGRSIPAAQAKGENSISTPGKLSGLAGFICRPPTGCANCENNVSFFLFGHLINDLINYLQGPARQDPRRSYSNRHLAATRPDCRWPTLDRKQISFKLFFFGVGCNLGKGKTFGVQSLAPVLGTPLAPGAGMAAHKAVEVPRCSRSYNSPPLSERGWLFCTRQPNHREPTRKLVSTFAKMWLLARAGGRSRSVLWYSPNGSGHSPGCSII